MPELDTVVAEISVEPAVDGPSYGQVVAASVEALRGPDLVVEPGPMGTVVRGDVEDVLHAVQRAHVMARREAGRVVTTVRLESRPDEEDAGERTGASTDSATAHGPSEEADETTQSDMGLP